MKKKKKYNFISKIDKSIKKIKNNIERKKQEKYDRKMRLEEIRYMAEYDWNYAIDKAEKVEIKKGKKQGRKLAKIDVALRMKEKDFSRDIIKKVTELPDKTMEILKIY